MSIIHKPVLTETRKMRRPDLRVSEISESVKHFSSEEMDRIIYLATSRAEAKAELRLSDK